VGDLAALPPALLERAVGRSQGGHLHNLAWARDERAVEAHRAVKSVSHEETFEVDRFHHDELHAEVVRLGDAVASRLRNGGLCGRTVTVKVRFGDFRTVTRSRRSTSPLDSAHEITAVAGALLRGVDVSSGVRLLGVGVSSLSSRGAGDQEQLELALGVAAMREAGSAGVPVPQVSAPARARAADAVDAIRRRFGDRAVASATLLDAGSGPDGAGLRLRRTGDAPWGPDRPEPGPAPGAGDLKG